MTTKQYTNIPRIAEQIMNGDDLLTLSTKYGISKFTMSKYFTQAVDSLTVAQIIELCNSGRDSRKVISPKTRMYKHIVSQTPQLPQNAGIRQRLWHIEHDQDEIPQCKKCDKTVAWEIDKQQYRTYCSIRCVNSDWETHNDERIATNRKRYGSDYWNQTHIPHESLALLADKEWLTNQHKTLKKSLGKIAEELGVHPLLPAQYLNRHGVPGQINSQACSDLITFIKDQYNGDIVINDRQILGGKELDVVLPELGLAFEYNGMYWHSEIAGIDRTYHVGKSNNSKAAGIRLIHIFEHHWLTKPNIIKNRIKHLISSSISIMARKCTIAKVSIDDERRFLNENHIQGYVASVAAYGLFFDNKLVCVMSFGKARYTAKCQWELLRLCTVGDCVVVGGASKLFTAFKREYSPTSVVSYSDNAMNKGGVYATIGFTYSHTSKPNYHYFHKSNRLTLYSRIKFQKHKLSDILDVFDPGLTEWENMQLNGYNRIWDCGNDVYRWSV